MLFDPLLNTLACFQNEHFTKNTYKCMPLKCLKYTATSLFTGFNHILLKLQFKAPETLKEIFLYWLFFYSLYIKPNNSPTSQ